MIDRTDVTANPANSKAQLGDKAASATRWAFASQVAAKLISPLTTMVLARLLTPEAFGVVASVTMVTSFADVFSDAGFQKYLVQHEYCCKDDLHRSASVAFWTNLTVSLGLWMLIAAFNEQIATAVGNPGLGMVLVVAGFSILLTALISVQTGLFQRALDYRVLFKSKVISSVVMLAVSVSLALLGFDYWSMVFGTISSNVFICVFLTVKSSWRPCFFFSFKELGEMFSFSGWTLLETISIWLVSWAGTFIVANTMTQNQVGLYKTATQMGTAVMGIVTSSVMPILFSSLSRLSSDRKAFDATLYKVQACLAYVLVPMCCCLLLFRDLVITVCLGDQWLDASLYLGLFFFSSSIKIVLNNICAEAYRSMGKPMYSMMVELAYLVILVPLLSLACANGWGAFSVAAGLAKLCLTVITLVVSHFLVGLSPRRMLKNCAPVFVAALSCSVAVFLVRTFLPKSYLFDAVLIMLYIALYLCLTYSSDKLSTIYNAAVQALRLPSKLLIAR